MAAGSPARSPPHVKTVRKAAQCDSSSNFLEVALQAEVGVALRQHFWINRAVWFVAKRAPFANGLVFEHVRPSLGRMAFEACFVRGGQRCSASHDRRTAMRIMTVSTAHLSRQDWMAVREMKFSPFVQVALKTGFRGFLGIDDRVESASGFGMNASGTVTGLTSHVCRVVAKGLKV